MADAWIREVQSSEGEEGRFVFYELWRPLEEKKF
jgi:hypothetical protein